jgi:AcrR family transcriptional regulator
MPRADRQDATTAAATGAGGRRAGRPRADNAQTRARRGEIKRAAVKVFADKGYHAARVSDIAREADVAHGLVYHYFASKEELLEEVFRTTWGHIEQGLESIADDASLDAGEQLAEVVRLMLGSFRLAPELVRVVILEVTRSGALRSQVGTVDRAFRIIERIIAAGQLAGTLRADVDARFASFIFWGAIDEVLTAWVFGTLPAEDDDVARAELAVVQIALGGLSAAP